MLQVNLNNNLVHGHESMSLVTSHNSWVYFYNRNMSKSKGWTLQSSLLTLWMEKTRVNNQTKIDDNEKLTKTW